MIQGKYLYYGDDLSEAFEIRKQVFVLEQGVSLEAEFDNYDDLAVHVIVYDKADNKNPVATGRVYHDGNNYKIGRIAVIKEERGKQYGDFVVRLLINKAFLSGADEIIINAQVSAIPFYAKIGFIAYGKIFKEAGIDHISMRLKPGTLCKKCEENRNFRNF